MGSEVVNLRSACVFGRTDGERTKGGAGGEGGKERMCICVCCVLIVGTGLEVKLWDVAGASMMGREGHVEEPLE